VPMLTRCPSSATNYSHSLSLRELEEKSGVSYNTIWRIEDGRQGAHPRTVRKLAEALGVEPKELIRETS
jgi:transcriptional regulator with XRE-family HTH domain